MVSPTRLALPLAALLALALFVPALASADDRSFALTSISEAQKLSKAEKATGKAVSKANTKSRKSIAKARAKIKAVRAQTDDMAKAIKPEKPSSGTGTAAKEGLLELLKVEKGAYKILDGALVKLASGDVASANRNAKQANKRLKDIADDAADLGETLARLAAEG